MHNIQFKLDNTCIYKIFIHLIILSITMKQLDYKLEISITYRNQEQVIKLFKLVKSMY